MASPTLEEALIVIRMLVYADLLMVFGVTWFSVGAPTAAKDAVPTLRLRSFVGTLAVAGLVVSSLQMIAMAAAMSGAESFEDVCAASLTLVTAGVIGTAWGVRMVALALVLGAVVVLPARPRPALYAAVVGGGLALASLPWTGHGAMNDGAAGWWHLVADIAHLCAAGGWIGALVRLLLLLFDRGNTVDANRSMRLECALRGFSSMGTVFVATIVVTGIVNVWAIVGWERVLSLPESEYGALLIAKLTLFLLMLGLAALNRYWLTPALARERTKMGTRRAIRALRLTIGLETSAAVLILLLVASLGTLAPPR